MLKKYILLLMILSFGYGYLVEDVIERYENGYFKKVNYYERIFTNGYENQILVKERDFYENGHLEYEANFKDGEFHGKVVGYYENGQMSSIAEYENGHAINMRFDYLEDGTVHRESKHDLTNGIEYQKSYNYECPGNVLWLNKYSYFDGYNVRKYYEYYCNGNVRMEGMYFDGDPQGKFIYYYDNGNKSHEGELDEYQSRIGHWIHYHKNGNKSHEGKYCYDDQYGIWKEYDLEGNFVKSRDYEECNDEWDDW